MEFSSLSRHLKKRVSRHNVYVIVYVNPVIEKIKLMWEAK